MEAQLSDGGGAEARRAPFRPSPIYLWNQPKTPSTRRPSGSPRDPRRVAALRAVAVALWLGAGCSGSIGGRARRRAAVRRRARPVGRRPAHRGTAAPPVAIPPSPTSLPAARVRHAAGTARPAAPHGHAVRPNAARPSARGGADGGRVQRSDCAQPRATPTRWSCKRWAQQLMDHASARALGGDGTPARSPRRRTRPAASASSATSARRFRAPLPTRASGVRRDLRRGDPFPAWRPRIRRRLCHNPHLSMRELGAPGPAARDALTPHELASGPRISPGGMPTTPRRGRQRGSRRRPNKPPARGSSRRRAPRTP
jgi:hypothetical protein